ncbi:MAG: nucleotidyltransferase domain-containing protein [Magnetococcus sp. DMHC-8]
MNGIALPPYRFIEQIKALPCVTAIYLYGSRARNSHRPRSDIDLAIVCPAADAAEWQQILDIVEEADTLLLIDCLRLDEEPAESPLRQQIEQNHQVIYARAG